MDAKVISKIRNLAKEEIAELKQHQKAGKEVITNIPQAIDLLEVVLKLCDEISQQEVWPRDRS